MSTASIETVNAASTDKEEATSQPSESSISALWILIIVIAAIGISFFFVIWGTREPKKSTNKDLHDSMIKQEGQEADNATTTIKPEEKTIQKGKGSSGCGKIILGGVVVIFFSMVQPFVKTCTRYKLKHKDNIEDIRNSVRQSNAQMPISMGGGLTQKSMEYDEDQKLIVLNIDCEEEDFAYYLESKETMHQRILISFSDGKFPSQYKIFVQENLGMKCVIKSKATKKTITVVCSAEEIRNAINTPTSPTERMQAYVDAEKAQLPMKIAEGITETDVKIENNSMIAVFSVSDVCYDALQQNREEIKKSYFEKIEDNLQIMLQAYQLAELDMGLITQYIARDKKQIDIVLTPDEIKQIADNYLSYKQQHGL